MGCSQHSRPKIPGLRAERKPMWKFSRHPIGRNCMMPEHREGDVQGERLTLPPAYVSSLDEGSAVGSTGSHVAIGHDLKKKKVYVWDSAPRRPINTGEEISAGSQGAVWCPSHTGYLSCLLEAECWCQDAGSAVSSGGGWRW